MTTFRDNLLAGKTAFVAGGTSGINLGIAKRFAELGAKVAVAGRDPDKAQRAAAEIGHDAIGLSGDVRDYAAIRGVMETVADKLGPMDIVISGAAGNFLAPVLGMSANAFRTVVDIDLNGTFNVFRGCHDLLKRPGASLIAITAGQAIHPMSFQIHACAAKAGVNMVTKCLALEWGPAGVRVNAISPGPIGDTEGMRRLADPAREKAIKARLALRDYGAKRDIADAALFLSSPEAKYITGTILNVDGGSDLGDASADAVGG